MALGKYPWSSWFARTRVEIVRGVDYTISQSTMHQSIRNAASKAGVSVRLQDTGGSIIIEVVGGSGNGNKDTNVIALAAIPG